MNIIEEKQKLSRLLKQYLNNEIDHCVINNYVWDIIEYFTDTPAKELPKVTLDEKSFWYAIWEVQHLADPEHIECNSIQEDLKETLAILNNAKPIPTEYIGKRPR